MSPVEAKERIETARLRLERWDPTRHTAALVELNADPEVMRCIGDGRPATRAESERQSGALAAHWARYGFGLWAVHMAGRPRSDGGPVLGFAGLSHPLWLPREVDEVEVGWRLRRTAWGQGVATEAGRAALELAFGPLGLERVVSYIRPENGRSQAVALRLGMALTRSVPHPRFPHDLEVWELLRAAHGGRLAAARALRPLENALGPPAGDPSARGAVRWLVPRPDRPARPPRPGAGGWGGSGVPRRAMVDR